MVAPVLPTPRATASPGLCASGKRSPTGVDDPELERKWWTSNGAHPNWIIPNRPDPVNGQLRFMDTVVTVAKA